MQFSFSEDQLARRAAVRQALEAECPPAELRARASGSRGDGRPWEALGAMGACGLLVEEAFGGLGLDDVAMVGILEEAGWAALPDPLAETAALVGPLLGRLAAGGPSCAAPGGGPGGPRTDLGRWLAALAAGRLVAGVGGVDLGPQGLLATTRAGAGPPDRAGVLVTPRVAGGCGAGLLVLCAPAPPSAEHDLRRSAPGWEIHVVEPGSEGTTVAPSPSLDATRDLATVTWAPSPNSLVADGPAAGTLVAELADRGALAAAAQLVGLADRMIALAARHAGERHQFGRPIGSFQAVKHHLASARVKLEFARPVVYRAADSVARQLPTRTHDTALAKALASDTADLAARVALQVHGAMGYTWEADLHLWMKRAWALSAAWGSAGVQRARVLAAVLDQGPV